MSKGMKSTEFWLSLTAMVAATYLAKTGASLEMIIAVTGGAGAYTLSRGIAKRGEK